MKCDGGENAGESHDKKGHVEDLEDKVDNEDHINYYEDQVDDEHHEQRKKGFTC